LLSSLLADLQDVDYQSLVTGFTTHHWFTV